MLPNVTFTTVPGGLGRLPDGADYVSAIIMPLAASPAAWTEPVGKKYLSLQEAEADLIIDGSANYGLLWYFVKEYFRIAGPSELWVINFSHANYNTQKFYAMTEGRVRQAYRYAATAYAGIAAFVGTLQTFANEMAALFAPIQMLTTVKDETTAIDGTAQPDLRALNSENVSVLISGDNSNKGKEIATALGIDYVPAAGAVLGAMSLASVHESIAWVAKFNLQGGAELQRTKVSDGTDIDSISAAIQDTLNTKGYLFLKRHLGIAGSYLNDSHTATAATSDYAQIENNRTMQKAKRNVRAALLPDLNSPLTVDADGKLAPDTVKYFENKADRPLSLMVSATELSTYQVIVDPEQNVLSTSKLIVLVRLIPRGVARYIDVNIGFTVSIG
jgi:hypothetical protein